MINLKEVRQNYAKPAASLFKKITKTDSTKQKKESIPKDSTLDMLLLIIKRHKTIGRNSLLRKAGFSQNCTDNALRFLVKNKKVLKIDTGKKAGDKIIYLYKIA